VKKTAFVQRTLLPAITVLLLAPLTAIAADTITNTISAVVSYQYQDSVSQESPSGGIISAVASYQYLDSVAAAPTFSHVTSYQYFDAVTDDSLVILTSPEVSYFFGPSIFGPLQTISGHVFQSPLAPVDNATIIVSVLDREITRVASDTTGTFMVRDLAPDFYTLTARKDGFVFDSRVIQLSPATQIQNFLLRPFQSTIQTTTADSIPPTSYQPQSTEIPAGVLKWFNNGAFETAPLSLPKKQTIVLTHGWTAHADQWTNVAKAITNINPKIDANILAWDWKEVADMPVLLIPEYATMEEGVQLGEALYTRLGSAFAQNLHLVGHSLGTLVNRYAADYVHGRSFNGRFASPAWNPKNTHLTLLDEAELARLITAISGSVLILPTIEIYGSEALDWKSPIPVDHGWIDNYISAYGLPHRSAFNVLLDYGVSVKYPPPFHGNPIYNAAAHSYAVEWYLATIERPSLPLAGFRHSAEFNSVDPVRSGKFPPDDYLSPDRYYRQIHPCFTSLCFLTEDQELELESPAGFGFYDCIAPALGGDARTIYKGDIAVIENSADFVVDVAAESARLTKNATVTTYQTTKTVAVDVYNTVTDEASKLANAVVDLGSTAALRVETTLRNIFPLEPKNKSAHAPADLWEHATLPLVVPSDADAFAFDFRVSGDPSGATIVFGVNGTNQFTLPAQFVTTNVTQTSRLFDAKPFVGKTNDFFFGFTGQTSTSCTLTVENIRFFTTTPPTLSVASTSTALVLSWPSTATTSVLESTTNLGSPDLWTPITDPPALFNGRLTESIQTSDTVRFFRLRR
jgi:pimeloyl-ACP methyl ester carboxylesterase